VSEIAAQGEALLAEVVDEAVNLEQRRLFDLRERSV
jgi:hypothetical protein